MTDECSVANMVMSSFLCAFARMFIDDTMRINMK